MPDANSDQRSKNGKPTHTTENQEELTHTRSEKMSSKGSCCTNTSSVTPIPQYMTGISENEEGKDECGVPLHRAPFYSSLKCRGCCVISAVDENVYDESIIKNRHRNHIQSDIENQGNSSINKRDQRRERGAENRGLKRENTLEAQGSETSSRFTINDVETLKFQNLTTQANERYR